MSADMQTRLFKKKKIPEEELKANKGFMLAQDHLLHRIDQEWSVSEQHPLFSPFQNLEISIDIFLEIILVARCSIINW